MSRFVSPNQERGFVNYEEMVKFLARCLGENSMNNRYQPYGYGQQPPQSFMPQGQYGSGYNQQGMMMKSPRADQSEAYDPDEQAILRQMHENMRDWDQVNLINCDNLRKRFYEVDPYNRYILTQREVSDWISNSQ